MCMLRLITHIKCLVGTRNTSTVLRGVALGELPCLEDAFLLLDGDRTAAYGSMKDIDKQELSNAAVVDARGAFALPAWCDSHTHLVFAASREEEFVDKIRGMSYEAIAAKGGGILNSVRKLQEMPEEQLFEQSLQRLYELIRLGTGAIEIKSGYGLSVEGELKILRVIKKLKTVKGVTSVTRFDSAGERVSVLGKN